MTPGTVANDFFIEDALQGLLEGKSVAPAKTLGNRARFGDGIPNTAWPQPRAIVPPLGGNL